MPKYRIEKDSLGEVKVLVNAYYGAQTQRAVENFPISGLLPYPEYVRSVVIIKKVAAIVNNKLNLLSDKKARVIIKACEEILSRKFVDQFIVDPYQAGAGTSHNMNVNEVVANRANEILGAPLGSYKFIHPNDDVNMSQSTNDVIPAAMRISVLLMQPQLLKTVNELINTLNIKSKEFNHIVKAGRTHLQDALPVTLGQEFAAFRDMLTDERQRLTFATENLLKIGIGGTAVGTGINTNPNFHLLMITQLKNQTKLSLISCGNLFVPTQSANDFLAFSGVLRNLAVTLIKIGKDLRVLSSGPRTGLSEIHLPAVQPGSSIMPGKVNPSVTEMLIMVCFQVIGLDQSISIACQQAELELQVMTPLIIHNILTQIKLLTKGIDIFTQKCIRGTVADEEMCKFWLSRSVGSAAVLNPIIGYDKTAALVKESLDKNIPLKELAVKNKYLSKNQADKLFSLIVLTKPNL
jgi:fumarate hydratase, class II